VPSGLPPRVYLKVAARDAAGNVREIITRDPLLVDLVKPKARFRASSLRPHCPGRKITDRAKLIRRMIVTAA